MKLILNVLLYITQKVHMKMGGKVLISKDEIILQAPQGRHWEIPEKYDLENLKGG